MADAAQLQSARGRRVDGHPWNYMVWRMDAWILRGSTRCREPNKPGVFGHSITRAVIANVFVLAACSLAAGGNRILPGSPQIAGVSDSPKPFVLHRSDAKGFVGARDAFSDRRAILGS